MWNIVKQLYPPPKRIIRKLLVKEAKCHFRWKEEYGQRDQYIDGKECKCGFGGDSKNVRHAEPIQERDSDFRVLAAGWRTPCLVISGLHVDKHSPSCPLERSMSEFILISMEGM